MTELLELKQYAFALYWGQEVIQDVDNAGNVKLYPVERSNMYRFDESALQLRPLSSITDDEAIEVAKIINVDYSNDRDDAWFDFEGLVYYIQSLYSQIESGCGFINKYIALNSYLQQQGFAIPIYFKGVQYSVERLVELGIVTLKS